MNGRKDWVHWLVLESLYRMLYQSEYLAYGGHTAAGMHATCFMKHVVSVDTSLMHTLLRYLCLHAGGLE